MESVFARVYVGTLLIVLFIGVSLGMSIERIGQKAQERQPCIVIKQ